MSELEHISTIIERVIIPMSLLLHPFSVQICKQHVNTTKTAKDEPIIYEPIKFKDNELNELTLDQLNHILLEIHFMAMKIEGERIRRNNKIK